MIGHDWKDGCQLLVGSGRRDMISGIWIDADYSDENQMVQDCGSGHGLSWRPETWRALLPASQAGRPMKKSIAILGGGVTGVFWIPCRRTVKRVSSCQLPDRNRRRQVPRCRLRMGNSESNTFLVAEIMCNGPYACVHAGVCGMAARMEVWPRLQTRISSN